MGEVRGGQGGESGGWGIWTTERTFVAELVFVEGIAGGLVGDVGDPDGSDGEACGVEGGEQIFPEGLEKLLLLVRLDVGYDKAVLPLQNLWHGLL